MSLPMAEALKTTRREWFSNSPSSGAHATRTSCCRRKQIGKASEAQPRRRRRCLRRQRRWRRHFALLRDMHVCTICTCMYTDIGACVRAHFCIVFSTYSCFVSIFNGRLHIVCLFSKYLTYIFTSTCACVCVCIWQLCQKKIPLRHIS